MYFISTAFLTTSSSSPPPGPDGHDGARAALSAKTPHDHSSDGVHALPVHMPHRISKFSVLALQSHLHQHLNAVYPYDRSYCTPCRYGLSSVSFQAV